MQLSICSPNLWRLLFIHHAHHELLLQQDLEQLQQLGMMFTLCLFYQLQKIYGIAEHCFAARVTNSQTCASYVFG